VNRVIEPLLRIFGQVNPFSLMPLFLLFFGLGEVAHVAVMAWVSLWPILRHTVGGVRSVDRAILRSARSMGVHGPAWLFGVLLPAAAHSIFTGVRAGGGLLFFMLIGAEMIGAGAGLGWFLHNAAANYQITRIYAAGILILVCGALLDAALAAFERRVPFRIGPRGMGAAGLALAVIVIVTAPAIRAMDRANAQVMTGHPSCHETHNQPEPTPDDLERLSKELTGAH
jgi:NitT/TauT family transport system permease protein